jgi:hypothetical protein
MTTLILTCRVADYETWRPLYDDAVAHSPEIRSWRVWHGQDDRNFVVIEETYDSREHAEELLNRPETQQEIASHGVDMSSMQVWFLDEDGAGSR